MKFETGEAVVRHGDSRPHLIEWTHLDNRVTLAPYINGKVILEGRDTIDASLVFYRNPTLQYFRFNHLPDHLQQTSRAFHRLAHDIALALPPCTQLDVALQHLLEAKDAAVRSRLFE